jgi:hypothetical protein
MVGLSNSKSSEIQEDYFQWLCGLVGIATPSHSYWHLARHLHRKEFYWTVPNDDNREKDGKKLREEYLDETGVIGHQYLEGICSVFEMLIALATRMEYILMDPNEGDRTSKWFFEFIRNLDLEGFTDEDFVDRIALYKIDLVVDKMLERGYTHHGVGGIFPIRRTKNDQRKVEIWYQMQAYLDENYDI